MNKRIKYNDTKGKEYIKPSAKTKKYVATLLQKNSKTPETDNSLKLLIKPAAKLSQALKELTQYAVYTNKQKAYSIHSWAHGRTLPHIMVATPT